MSRSKGTCNLVELAVGSCLAMAATQSFAQSTGSQLEEKELQEVVVTSSKIQSIEGLIQPEQAAKSRSSITSDYIATQSPGQSVIQSINLLPGVNFTNNDPFGSSGGDLRLRSFDGPRVSLMLDGVQLNDSGNYAIFTNQQVDSEIVDRVSVNLGTTDADSPTASATGGTINIVTQRPKDSFSVQTTLAGGSDQFRRGFLRFDSGKFGPFDTTAFLTVSDQSYNKFKGPGELRKVQVNGKLYQDFGNDNFISLAVHYNRNRNAFYRNLTLGDIAKNGYGLDYDPTCPRPTPGAGTVQNEATTATGTTAICTNYFAVRDNPSDTGNVRMQSSFGLTDSLRLTVDPSYQYVQANGGGISIVPENDRRLIGASTAPGVDLNGDGDTRDRVAVYSPNNTNTNRYSIDSSLIWTINEHNLLRLSYTRDYARHRQTGQWALLDAFGNPTNVFGGRDGTPIKSADGFDLRGRDRFSIAKLDQGSLSYLGRFLDRRIAVNVGVRAPFFHRDLNQYCYTATNSGAAFCTSEPPVAVGGSTTVVTFPGVTGNYLRPFNGTKDYNKVLPYAGITLTPWGDANQFYADYAEGLSAPRTDNLYSVQILDVLPETTKSSEVGYRFQGNRVTASTALWQTHYNNRIVTSFDPDQGISVDRNVGTVNLWGVDSELGFKATRALSFYASASYDHSRVEGNIPFSATVAVPTAGKQLVETPTWTFASRAQYSQGPVTVGLQAKYVSKRYSTDLNDEFAPAYTVADLDARYTFAVWKLTESYVQVNVTNLFDRQYLGSIATSRFSADTTKPYGAAPLYAVGAPRTFLVSVHVNY